MSSERTETLRRAEAWLRQGRVEEAIGEYARALESQPDDWSTARVLGDLYVRAGKSERGIEQFLRIGSHLADAGFFPKAAALYKKILKIDPHCEEAALQLAEVCAAQGLLVEARRQLEGVDRRRRERGDEAGAQEVAARLASLHGVDLSRQIEAARLMAAGGDAAGARARLEELAASFSAPGQREDRQRLQETLLGISPDDLALRRQVALEAAAAGDAVAVDRVLAQGDPPRDVPHLRLAVDANLRLARVSELRVAATRLATTGPEGLDAMLEIIGSAAGVDAATVFPGVEAFIETVSAGARIDLAVEALERFLEQHPAHPPALLRLIDLLPADAEPSRRAALERTLASAYLDHELPAEARGLLDRVLARDQDDLEALSLLERALRDLGDQPAADAAAARLASLGGAAAREADAPTASDQSPAEVDEADQTTDEIAGETDEGAGLEDGEGELDEEDGEEEQEEEDGDDEDLEDEEEEASVAAVDATLEDDDVYVLDRETFHFTTLTESPDSEAGISVEIDLTNELELLGSSAGPRVAAPPRHAVPVNEPEPSSPPAPAEPVEVVASARPRAARVDPAPAQEPIDRLIPASDVSSGRDVPGVETASQLEATADERALQAILEGIRSRLGPGELAERSYWQGVAFRGAGLDDAARAAFAEASRDPQLMVQAALALGEMAEEQDRLDEARSWYERATSELEGDQELRWYALYRFAVVLEATGEPSRALSVLLELLAEAADYRDARARVDRLAEVETGG